MKTQIIIKAIFQLSAFGLFVFQMQNSVLKYFAKPVVIESSSKDLADIEKPVFYVCQDEQFNYTKAKTLGYKHQTDYTKGKLKDSDSITWRGKDGNKTFMEMQKLLFEYNYTSHLVQLTNKGWYNQDVENDQSEEVYFAPYGFCMKLKKIKSLIYISSTEKSKIYIVDPVLANDVRNTFVDNGKLTFGPTVASKKFFDYYVLKMIISLHDQSIYAGQKCTIYENLGTFYGDCLKDLMKSHLLKWYGCLPPWFPNSSSLTCETSQQVQLSSFEVEEMSDMFLSFVTGKDLKIWKTCLPPCVTMTFELKENTRITNRQGCDSLIIMKWN